MQTWKIKGQVYTHAQLMELKRQGLDPRKDDITMKFITNPKLKEQKDVPEVAEEDSRVEEEATEEPVLEEAVAEIPEPFRSYLHNVEIVIEDRPSPSLLREVGLDPRRDSLFGLYQGVPLTEREANPSMLLPDRITIFYLPLVRSFSAPGAIRREVRRTVIHEIGHFFGLDEEQIRENGF